MIKRLTYRFLQQEEGATSVEYAVMLVLIAAVCLAAIQLVGVNARDIWNDNSDGINSVLGDLD